MATFRINDADLKIRLRNFSAAIRPAPILRIFAAIMRESRERTFREQGSPAGSWPPLALSTLRQRGARSIRARQGGKGLQGILSRASRNLFGAGKILIRSGRLKNSITEAVVTAEAGQSRLLIGTNLIYGAIHQVGGLAGRGHKAKIPARPYLVFRPEDPARMQQAAEHFIDQQTQAAGL